MAAIRGKDTKPEMIVRKYLFSRGFRYRLNHPRLPGHPDIVLRKYRTVIFVNGCFWHGHEGCRYSHLPRTNVAYWQAKIGRMGWHCITVWECELKPAKRNETLESLAYTLNHIYLKDRSIVRYEFPEEIPIIAAEPEPEYGKQITESK